MGLPKIYPLGGKSQANQVARRAYRSTTSRKDVARGRTAKRRKEGNITINEKNRGWKGATHHQLERCPSWRCRPGHLHRPFVVESTKRRTVGLVKKSPANRVALIKSGSSRDRTTNSRTVAPASKSCPATRDRRRSWTTSGHHAICWHRRTDTSTSGAGRGIVPS